VAAKYRKSTAHSMRRSTCNDPPMGYKREAKSWGMGTSIWRGRNAAEIRSEHLLDRAGLTQEAVSVPRDARVLPADPCLATNENRSRRFYGWS
jgi:hypothetical protein